jgi:Xaa-Pro aminopeptidase
MDRQRIALLRREMRNRGVDAFIVSSVHNIRYLTGFSGSHGLCIVRSKNAVFLTDPRYKLQSKSEVRGCTRFITTTDLFEEAARRKVLSRCRRVAFESLHLTYAQYRQLRKLFSAVSFEPTSDVVENFTVVKNAEEVARITEAVEISDRVFADVVNKIRPGMKELDVAAEISYLHRRYGAEQDSFETIVASGPRGALPHARATSKRIRNGEFVILDFGCTKQGYSSDLTRTIAVGSVPQRGRRIYNSVLNAQQAAIESVRAGMRTKDLDAVARQRLASDGYGKYFVHSLGHGLGLQIHEKPRISRLSKEHLVEGSVVTIEPGVYIPEFGGVRIEDDVLVTETGCRVLSSAPKNLMIL